MFRHERLSPASEREYLSSDDNSSMPFGRSHPSGRRRGERNERQQEGNPEGRSGQADAGEWMSATDEWLRKLDWAVDMLEPDKRNAQRLVNWLVRQWFGGRLAHWQMAAIQDAMGVTVDKHGRVLGPATNREVSE